MFNSIYNKNKETPPYDLLVDLMTKLKSSKILPPPDLTTKYRASGLSKICERQEVLRSILMVEMNEEIDPTLQMTFDIGHGFHHIVQNKWLDHLLHGDWLCLGCAKRHIKSKKPETCQCGSKSFQYIELEYDSDELFLTGHPDGVLVLPSGHKILLELKTTNSQYFQYIVSSGRPLAAHVDQVMIYLRFTGLKDCAIFYFSKDDSKIKMFKIKYDESRFLALIGKIKVIKGGIKNKSVPSRNVCDSISCSRAKSCPVKKECFSFPVEGGFYGK